MEHTFDETLQNFINKQTIDLENDKLHDVKLVQIRYQNLSMSKANRL